MSQSKRMDRPRCPECRKKGEIREPEAVSVRYTGFNEWVTMKCSCGYQWKSKGESAFRLAVYQGKASYKSNTNT